MHLHLQWVGPYDYASATMMRDSKTDFGIYQVYGTHPIYGSDALLYVGKASEQTFGTRLSQHDWIAHNQDSSRIQIYLGRLHTYADTPVFEEWSRQISIVERLLIFAHTPAGNSSGLNVSLDDDVQAVHVLNWGQFRDLMPEVSGVRYSARYSSYQNYRAYGADSEANEVRHGR